MPDPGSIAIRPYRTDDERDLVELFRRAFGQSVTEDHWRWKLKRPHSPTSNVWLAVCEEKPVFQYAGIPTRFQLADGSATVMVSVDTMTAPEFRRRGLLTQVAQQVYSAWRAGGVAFVLGLPNNQWGSRAAALGWQELFPLQWLVRPLRPHAILARRLKMPLLSHVSFPSALWNRLLQARVHRDPQVRIERASQADAAFDQLWDACKSDWAFSTVRDRDWVQWRFLSAPSSAHEVTLARRAGRPTGYCAYSLLGSGERVHATLADMLFARQDLATRDTLLSDLIDRLIVAKAEAVSTLAVPGTAHHRWLRHVGFFPRQAFSVQVVPLSANLPLERMRDPHQWNLSGADFDVI